MKYSFSAIASHVAATALLCIVVTIGSAIPAAANPLPSTSAAVPASGAEAIVSGVEDAVEMLLFGPGAAVVAGPVHPILDVLQTLI